MLENYNNLEIHRHLFVESDDEIIALKLDLLFENSFFDYMAFGTSPLDQEELSSVFNFLMFPIAFISAFMNEEKLYGPLNIYQPETISSIIFNNKAACVIGLIILIF